MSNGFFSSNRPQRESEPRMSNERSRDFGGAPSRGSDRSGAGRESSGEEALLELARLIGGQNDPFSADAAAQAPRADPRLADVSRTAASKPYEGRPFEDRGAPSRRDPGFGDRETPPPAPDDGDYDFGDRSRSGRGRLDYRAAREEQHEEEEYSDDEYAEPDEFDDEPGGKRRRPLRVVTTLLGLAVFGGAAAYGYRTMTAAPSAPPPVIRADNSPTKIKPMSDARPDSARAAPLGEQVVRREEDPVDVVGAQGSGNAGAVDVVPPAMPPRGDPKRVHTVPIRADQGTSNSPDRPAGGAAPPASRQAAAPPPPPPPAAAPAPATRQLAALPPQPASPPQQPAAPPPQAAAAPAPQPPSPPPQRQAAVAPPADTAAAAPSDSGTGGYVVQLTAVKSETDAQSEFRRLQTKYATVLSGRQPLIRRKDQGDRGIFFVAQVGPFGAKGEADQLCGQLKAAGGTCYVYKN
jgi:hypothetical protein